MPNYTRSFTPGGTFFFTLVTYRRQPFLDQAMVRHALREAIQTVRLRRPFIIDASVLLPDHLHMIWTLPPGDTDFSTRWRLIKEKTTRQLTLHGLKNLPAAASRQKKKERTIWQRRFWEHTVRDEDELSAFCDYIHYNPVKHGQAQCPHAWPYSSFHRFVEGKLYSSDWLCCCREPVRKVMSFDMIREVVGE